MKKVNITVSFDDEKLDALVYFMKKDNIEPQKALQNELEKLYEKYIPAEMRGYLESRLPAQSRDRAKRPSRSAPPKPKVEGSRASGTTEILNEEAHTDEKS